jgi:hypothetical protein
MLRRPRNRLELDFFKLSTLVDPSCLFDREFFDFGKHHFADRIQEPFLYSCP